MRGGFREVGVDPQGALVGRPGALEGRVAAVGILSVVILPFGESAPGRRVGRVERDRSLDVAMASLFGFGSRETAEERRKRSYASGFFGADEVSLTAEAEKIGKRPCRRCAVICSRRAIRSPAFAASVSRHRTRLDSVSTTSRVTCRGVSLAKEMSQRRHPRRRAPCPTACGVDVRLRVLSRRGEGADGERGNVRERRCDLVGQGELQVVGGSVRPEVLERQDRERGLAGPWTWPKGGDDSPTRLRPRRGGAPPRRIRSVRFSSIGWTGQARGERRPGQMPRTRPPCGGPRVLAGAFQVRLDLGGGLVAQVAVLLERLVQSLAISGGRSGFNLTGGAGARCRIASKMIAGVAPAKSWRPWRGRGARRRRRRGPFARRGNLPAPARATCTTACRSRCRGSSASRERHGRERRRPHASAAGSTAAISARPKSRIFTCPRLLTKMFAGLMSRWTIPF